MSFELQRTCTWMVKIKWCWFHSKYSYLAKIWHACPYLGIHFFGHIGLTFFLGTQETNIIYRLVVINPGYDAYFSFLIFGTFLAGIWAWQLRARLIVWGLQTRQKSWPTGWTLWASHYLEIMFSKIAIYSWQHFQQIDKVFLLIHLIWYTTKSHYLAFV